MIEDVRKQLEKQLEKVNRRLELLDMIEEKLYHMKTLTQMELDEKLSKEKLLEINMKINNPGEQIKLLDMEITEIS